MSQVRKKKKPLIVRKIRRKKKPGSHGRTGFLLALSGIITLAVALTLMHFLPAASDEQEEQEVYDRYYVMITEDTSSLWQSVYEGALDTALEDHVYVDWLGEDQEEYSVEDQMEIAIASSVDGIIINADEDESVTDRIDQAAEAGIPVVTLYTDNTASARCSFVGIGSYNLGKEYGRKALQIVEEKAGEGDSMIAVLVNSYAQSLDQNILYAGIQEAIAEGWSGNAGVEVRLLAVDDTNDFSVEESIRDIFWGKELPDIIICLNELATTCVYQAVVDYNRVGQVSILGYYDSETILRGIEREVISATVSIDARQMGQYCMDALEEYHELGYTSQYFTADITMIDKTNVAEYLEGNADEEKG